jgi:DNA/RNA endonuclease YhcR with UshA esterase domain
VVGLGVLWFVAVRVEVPVVQIGQVGGMMNMAYVRIEGRVSQGPDYDPEGEYMAFWVTDDTGELRVSVYRNETRNLIAEGRIPSTGDQVRVAGTLRIREDFVALYLNAPEQLEIVRPEPVEMQIGEVSPLDVGQRIRVRGQVRQIYEPYEGLTLISLRDDSGEIDVAVGETLELLTGPLPPVSPGQALEAVGAVSLYRDTPQLVPALTSDIVLTSGTAVIVPQRDVGTLTTSDVGQWVQVEGAIVESDAFSSGIRFVLDDGTGQILLLLWQSIYESFPHADTLDVGARVQIQGHVAEYKGVLEIVPEVSQDLVVLVAAPAPEETVVAELALADVGRMVQLQGILSQEESFSKGIRYTLDDGTGQILLVLWSNVVEEASAELRVGTEVSVLGEITEYRGDLEIVPRCGADIQVLGQSPLPTPTPRTLNVVGDIAENDQGRTLTVEGILRERETF